MSAVPTTAAPAAVRHSALALARRLALPFLFAGSCVFQALQARAHASPTVFNDELLYAKLSQAIAAGHGLAIRGQHYAFPSPVAPLLQAPAWLFGSMTEGYAAAKIANAIVMSAAVFPAYWLASRYVRRSFALVVAAATVATPAMVYHAYLMSEAAAYPVFVLTVAVLVRAAAAPSRKLGIAVPAVCALAVATRVQFIVLPLAYVAAVAVCGRGRWRRYVLPLGVLAVLAGLMLLVPNALGQYGDATEYHYGIGSVAHWAVTNASLLPFSLGLAVVPGALLGVGYALVRPRSVDERAFAVVSVVAAVLFVGQAALISAGEAHRPLERYLFYVTPLVFLAFFLYVDRGAPRRVLHLGVAGVIAVLLSQLSLPGLTGTAAFFFDSVTESAYAREAYRLGLSDASLLFSLLPLGLAALAVALPLRRAGAAIALALSAIVVQLGAGTAVASTDHLVTGWALRTFGTKPADWLDRSHVRARYLALPDANPFLGTNLESWNRDVDGFVVLQSPAPDPFPVSVARVRDDGTLEIDERPVHEQVLVVNTSGSQIGLDGNVIERRRNGLVVYRVPASAQVHWLARGLAPDHWIGRRLTYTVWPRRPGTYLVELGLAPKLAPRLVEVSAGSATVHTVRVTSTANVRLTAMGPGPLRLFVHVPPGPVGARTFGVRVVSLRFVAPN
jgi:Dolichyl-phosphate-mannose-protein mannosyltransferase